MKDIISKFKDLCIDLSRYRERQNRNTREGSHYVADINRMKVEATEHRMDETYRQMDKNTRRELVIQQQRDVLYHIYLRTLQKESYFRFDKNNTGLATLYAKRADKIKSEMEALGSQRN